MTTERGKIFGCLKDAVAHKKDERLKAFQAHPLSQQMEQHTLYHWSTALRGRRLEFWPTTQKWRWKDKNYWGTLQNFENFLRKRGWNG